MVLTSSYDQGPVARKLSWILRFNPGDTKQRAILARWKKPEKIQLLYNRRNFLNDFMKSKSKNLRYLQE